MLATARETRKLLAWRHGPPNATVPPREHPAAGFRAAELGSRTLCRGRRACPARPMRLAHRAGAPRAALPPRPVRPGEAPPAMTQNCHKSPVRYLIFELGLWGSIEQWIFTRCTASAGRRRYCLAPRPPVPPQALAGVIPSRTRPPVPLRRDDCFVVTYVSKVEEHEPYFNRERDPPPNFADRFRVGHRRGMHRGGHRASPNHPCSPESLPDAWQDRQVSEGSGRALTPELAHRRERRESDRASRLCAAQLVSRRQREGPWGEDPGARGHLGEPAGVHARGPDASGSRAVPGASRRRTRPARAQAAYERAWTGLRQLSPSIPGARQLVVSRRDRKRRSD